MVDRKEAIVAAGNLFVYASAKLCVIFGVCSEFLCVYYVYHMRSKTHPGQTYVGSTHDLRRRLAEHNAGKYIHTNKFKPWNMVAYIALPENHLAEKMEKYSKTGSGRAFASRHLLAQIIKKF